jgi:hypothetical protein
VEQGTTHEVVPSCTRLLHEVVPRSLLQPRFKLLVECEPYRNEHSVVFILETEAVPILAMSWFDVALPEQLRVDCSILLQVTQAYIFF